MSAGAPSLVYFHGMPGGPGEWGLNAPADAKAWTPDCNSADCTIAALAAACPQNTTLIGFSLGAFTALRVAALAGDRIAHIHLISPAAPLQLGDFLGDMAGGPLFRMAMSKPRLFRFATRCQSWCARAAPGFLFDRLFASARGADIALARDAAFRSGMLTVLQGGLGQQPHGFARDASAYVDDWRELLRQISQPVMIWQGDADNWTPPAMARALASALPHTGELRLFPGLSHYSTLRTALAEIV